MSIAETIAKRIASKADTSASASSESSGTQPGDHGKRIYAAFNALRASGSQDDAIAFEEAIKDCVSDNGYDM